MSVAPNGLPVVSLEGFEDALRGLDKAVVLFTADWCGFCRRFAPEFEEAAARARVPFMAADISDDEGDPRWERYRIEVVPAVLVFEKGRVVDRADAVLGRGIPPREWRRLLAAHAG
jgi:thiol-disulfide isomerase/thioredoxin